MRVPHVRIFGHGMLAGRLQKTAAYLGADGASRFSLNDKCSALHIRQLVKAASSGRALEFGLPESRANAQDSFPCSPRFIASFPPLIRFFSPSSRNPRALGVVLSIFQKEQHIAR